MFPRKSHYKLWVLCHDVKRRLIKYYKIPEKNIGVLDRYSLFPIQKSNHSIINKSSDISYLYSARACTLKNFKLALSLVNYIGKQNNKIIDFEICAPLFKKEDFYFIKNDYPFVNVKMLGDLGTEWVKKIRNIPQKCLIQISLDPIDDFNVSSAQWQSQGGAILCSDMGPYRDLSYGNISTLSLKDTINVIDNKYNQETLEKLYQQINFIKTTSNNFKQYSPPPICHKKLGIAIKSINQTVRSNILNLNTYELNPFTRELITYDA
jgi:hypothetical protein